jgi:hypothetical protein
MLCLLFCVLLCKEHTRVQPGAATQKRKPQRAPVSKKTKPPRASVSKYAQNITHLAIGSARLLMGTVTIGSGRNGTACPVGVAGVRKHLRCSQQENKRWFMRNAVPQ